MLDGVFGVAGSAFSLFEEESRKVELSGDGKAISIPLRVDEDTMPMLA